jgi:hypothetical protein
MDAGGAAEHPAAADAGGEVGPSCSDHVRNGDETDVDCGGSCPPCAADGHCSADADCATHRCHAGQCSAACGLSGLLAHYPFDGDTRDTSGNGRDLVAGSVSATTGAFAGAYAFDGSKSTMKATGSGMLMGARTLCAWLDPSTTTGLGQPVFAGGATGRGDMYAIQSSTPAPPGGTCMTAAVEGEPFVDNWGTACELGVGLAVANNAWSLVCYVYDGAGTQRMFVNGTANATMGAVYDYAFSTLTVGSNAIGGTTTQAAFRGLVDEVTVWSRALTTAELGKLWNGGRSCVP